MAKKLQNRLTVRKTHVWNSPDPIRRVPQGRQRVPIRLVAEVHTGNRSIISIARLQGKSAIEAIRELTEGPFALA